MLTSIVTPPVLNSNRKRKTPPISGNRLRTLPGVTLKLNVYPTPSVSNSCSTSSLPGEISNGDSPEEYELDCRIINISSEAFARRMVRLKKSKGSRRSYPSSSSSISSQKSEDSLIIVDDEEEILAEANAMDLNTRTLSSRNANIQSSSRSNPNGLAKKATRQNPKPMYPKPKKPSVPKKQKPAPNPNFEFLNIDGSPKTHRDVVERIIKNGTKLEYGPAPGVSCQICTTRKTGQWRRGPDGPRTLCNGCGLAWAKYMRLQASRRRY